MKTIDSLIAERDDAEHRADYAEERVAELEEALRCIDDARRLARSYVGSLPIDLGELFEARQREADRSAERALGRIRADSPPNPERE